MSKEYGLVPFQLTLYARPRRNGVPGPLFPKEDCS